MTAQTPELLELDGQTIDLCAQPLYRWVEVQPPGFSLLQPAYAGNRTTACWRGYVGHWRVANGRLYLHALDPPEEGWLLRPFEELFPERTAHGAVFAHWVSGLLRCNVGELVQYVHHGYASQAEADRFLLFERGVLRAQRDFAYPGENEEPWLMRGDEVLTAFGIPLGVPVAPRDDSDDDWNSRPLPIEMPGARIEPLTRAAAEALGRLPDPLGEVPDVPFGHLHAGWRALLAQLQPGDELRHVHVPIGTYTDEWWVRMAPLMAIAVVRQGQAVHHFVYAGSD